VFSRSTTTDQCHQDRTATGIAWVTQSGRTYWWDATVKEEISVLGQVEHLFRSNEQLYTIDQVRVKTKSVFLAKKPKGKSITG